jgi:ethanolamine ammonia-lyase small subunit
MAAISKNELVIPDGWSRLRSATQARIALGRAGGSLPTQEWLEFKSAHAAARDAVHNEFDAGALAAEIGAGEVKVVTVETLAVDRLTYLQRPDLGRRLSDASRRRLVETAADGASPDLVIVISDGLSALAVHRQAPPLLAELLPRLRQSQWRLAPIVVARFGRVALEDEIGEALRAELALILIGERPGLGSPDSLGAYLVFAPRVGNTDAHRNCVSNVRPEGLPIAAAADTICYLLNEAKSRKLSGVQLKDQRKLVGGSPTTLGSTLP